MRVVILGAGGKQGRGAARVLATKDAVDEIVLVDVSERAVQEVAVGLSVTTAVRAVDVADVDAIVSLLRAHSPVKVVVNAAGPGFRLASAAMRASIEVGVHYVDLQDDVAALRDVEAFDGAAKEKGLAMVSGAGLAPGLTQILSRRAIDLLDSVDELELDWVSNMTENPTPANWGHRLGLSAMSVPIVRHGRLIHVAGGSDERTLDWPPPAGGVLQRVCAHPEVFTLHKNYPEVPNISVRGGYTPPEHDALLADLRDLGLTTLEPVTLDGVRISACEFISYFATTDAFRNTPRFREVLAREGAIGDHNGLRVRAVGKRGGESVTLTYGFFSRDRNIGIYTTAAVVAYLLLTDSVPERGVIFPEQLSPEPIIALVAQEGVDISETVTDEPSHGVTVNEKA